MKLNLFMFCFCFIFWKTIERFSVLFILFTCSSYSFERKSYREKQNYRGWRYREKRNDQEHHDNVSFFTQLNFDFVCLFVFEKMLSSIPMFLVMLLAHVAKRSNSRSQMFSKICVLKNFAIFTGQDWRPKFLFKKRFQRRCFSVNIAKF